MDTGITNALTVADLDVASEEAIESSFDDLDQITEAGMDLFDVDLNANGRIRDRFKRKDRAFDCATIEKDTVTRMVTIDFGRRMRRTTWSCTLR